MTRALFLFRPEPGWSRSAAAARAAGLTVDGQPLFDIEPAGWEAPQIGKFDGLLIGSANALRHGGEALGALGSLPAYCVGEETARAARAAGFDVAMTGSGGLAELLGNLSGRALRLLRLAGETHVDITPPPGIEVTTRIVYRAVPCPLDRALARRLAGGGVVTLHSGAAAQLFVRECARLGVDRGRLALAALAPRIAERAGGGWQSVHIAERSSDAQLLVLARALCQTG